jgi:2-dehydro-3-deoxyglucarate aldolase/4-hydroxy-2-oxoheptanedioate aldolase
MNILKEKIQQGKRVIGTHVSLSDPCICEIFGYLGFDYIWVDLEHTYIDCKALYVHVMACQSEDVSVIVRIPQHDYDTLKRVLEMGVDGIVFPMEHNAEETREDIARSLYPPNGVRGFGPRRAIRYGMDDVETYICSDSLDICRFVQLEHKQAIECLDEILKISFIDGFIFGPCDLAGSFGEPWNHLGQKTTKLIQRTIEYLKSKERYCGVSIADYSEASVLHWSKMGIDMISIGSDTDYLLSGAQLAYSNLYKIHISDNKKIEGVN